MKKIIAIFVFLLLTLSYSVHAQQASTLIFGKVDGQHLSWSNTESNILADSVTCSGSNIDDFTLTVTVLSVVGDTGDVATVQYWKQPDKLLVTKTIAASGKDSTFISGLRICYTDSLVVGTGIKIQLQPNIPIKLDNSSLAVNFIDYFHHEIHDSNAYIVSGYKDADNGDTLCFFYSVPDVDYKHPHLIFDFNTTKACILDIFTGCDSIPKSATAITPRNARHGTKSSYVTLKYIENPAPSIFPSASFGTKYDSTKVGATGGSPSAKYGGASGRSAEEILSTNTIYCFMFRSLDDTNVIDFWCPWYEHTDKVK